MSNLRIILVTLLTLLAQHKIDAYDANKRSVFNSSEPKNITNPTRAPTVTYARAARDILSRSDEYVTRNQRQCFETRSLVSCIKYKAAKIVWKLATNSNGFFPNEYARELRNDTRRIRFIQLGKSSELVVFSNARNLEGDSELTKIIKFCKRALETFAQNHGIQIALSNDNGMRITSPDVDENAERGHKKKYKWLIILPLIILVKIAHLKMKVVTLLLAVIGLNVLLIGGTAWLIHYLKFKTLCKIHPHLVQSHSHVYDSDPADYSQFVGSSFPGAHYSPFNSGPHEVSVNGYSKDWGSSKAYGGYNYLDTISHRLK